MEDSNLENTLNCLADHLKAHNSPYTQAFLERIPQILSLIGLGIQKFSQYQQIFSQLMLISRQGQELSHQALANKNSEEAEYWRSVRDQARKITEILHSQFANAIIKTLPQGFKALPDQIPVFFDDVIPTFENMNKRYNELCLHFHPDIWSWPPDQSKTAKDLLTYIEDARNKIKEILKSEIEETSEAEFFKEKGKEAYQDPESYKKCFSAQQPPLQNFIAAAELFKAACKAADKQNDLVFQAGLRRNLALCCLELKKISEAKIFVIASLLILDRAEQRNSELWEHSKQVFESIYLDYLNIYLVPTDLSAENLRCLFKTEFMNLMRQDFIKPVDESLVQVDKEGKNSEIQETLNSILLTALEEFNNGKYKQFIAALSIDYDPKGKKKVLSISSTIDDQTLLVISVKEIIENLKALNFRPEGIAYLLLLIGQAHLTEGFQFPGLSNEYLFQSALDIFRGILDESLQDYASDIDSKILEVKNPKLLSSIFQKSNEKTRLANIYSSDLPVYPTLAALEDFRDLARLYISVLSVFEGGEVNLEIAFPAISQVKKGVGDRNRITSSYASTFLKQIQDFYWVAAAEFRHISPDLKRSSNNPLADIRKKSDVLRLLGDQEFYVAKADLDKELQLQGTDRLQAAQQIYIESLDWDSGNKLASIRLARTMLGLNQLDKLNDLVKMDANLVGSFESWVFTGIVKSKTGEYESASQCFEEALTMKPNDPEALRYQKLNHTLGSGNKQEFLAQLNLGKPLEIAPRKGETKEFNILSIDGGGFRAILPGLFLSEIEKRVKKPISSLFNIMSGSSTGAFLAAGLSVPNNDGKYAKYSASGLTQMFFEQGSRYFKKDKSWFGKNSSYNNDRIDLFREFFKNVRLSNLMNEVLVPVCVNATPPKGYLHLTSLARAMSDHDHELVGTLMCTTATPKLFNAFKYSSGMEFIDGGVLVDNPTMMAYQQAFELGVNTDNIFILSLGTGLCCNEGNNKMYWEPEAWKNVREQHRTMEDALYGPQGDPRFERLMRVQPLLDRGVALDDYSSETIEYLVETAREMIEERYNDEKNSMNKLLERLSF